MKMDPLDLSKATPDQSFSLMLCERIEKLEEEFAAMKKAARLLSEKKLLVSPCAHELYDKLVELSQVYKEKDDKEIQNKLEKLVPEKLLVKIPDNHKKYLLGAISGDIKKQSYSLTFAMLFLENNTNLDKEIIQWYTKTLGLE